MPATAAELQHRVDASFAGMFTALSNRTLTCVGCGHVLAIGTGSLLDNLSAHLETSRHRAATQSRHITDFFTAVPDTRPVYRNLVVKCCKGYSATSVTYHSKRHGTSSTYNPMLLIYDMFLPLPEIGTGSTSSPIPVPDYTPSWRPHPFGLGTQGQTHPHFRSAKCRLFTHEYREERIQREPVEVDYTCDNCQRVPFERSFNMRLKRAHQRVERGGPPRGHRIGLEAMNYPTLRELVEVVPHILSAYRECRRKLVSLESRLLTDEARLQKSSKDIPQVRNMGPFMPLCSFYCPVRICRSWCGC